MVFIGFYVIFNPFINGPWSVSLMALFPLFADICEKYWWHNLLYINNLFDLNQGCYIITWYLAVDTQLYFVAPIFLIALFVSPYAGFALIILCIAGSIAFVYAVTFYNGFPAVLMGLSALERFIDFFSVYYQKPWARCSPYLVGLATGYLLAMAKKPKLNKLLVIALWAAAVAIALASLYGPHRYIKGADDWRYVN
ncbi:hypothetical protein OESDEN_12515 [Oesophagostomum dentatum]|uniref:Acyltransferase 3 domain-containing protein n=1 Tax=Oesophagostomum dentatum TaxID=61180 RepID=A0A0B1SQY9_OESDE|nr:hypothetical protein OESDEN_12515 [Oesophagostomum dentatum]